MTTWKLLKRNRDDDGENVFVDTGLTVDAADRSEAQRSFKKLTSDKLRFSGIGYSHVVDEKRA